MKCDCTGGGGGDDRERVKWYVWVAVVSAIVSGRVSGSKGQGGERTPEENHSSLSQIPCRFRFPKPPQPNSYSKPIDYMNKYGLHPMGEAKVEVTCRKRSFTFIDPQ